jgi:hypothetical protein
VGSDEPFRELGATSRDVEFQPAPVVGSRRLRNPLLAGSFGAIIIAVVALGASGPQADGTASLAGAGDASASAATNVATEPRTGSPTTATGAAAGSIALQVLPNGDRLSIIGDISAEDVRSVIVSVFDSTGTITDWRSLSIRHLDGGFRPDHWPAFAVTVQTARPADVRAVEAIAFDASGKRVASGHRFLGAFSLVTVPRVMVVRD